MFGNIKIGPRLGGGFAVVLVFSMLVSGIGVWRLKTVAKETRAMMDVPLSSERLVSEWNTLLLIAIQRTTSVVKSKDPELQAFLAKEAAQSSKISTETLTQVERLLASDEERQLFKSINEYRKKFLEIRDRIYKAKKDGTPEEINRLFETEYVPIAKSTQDEMRKLLDYERGKIDAISRHVEETSDNSQKLILLLEAIILLSGVFFAVMLTRSITRPINIALDISKQVSSGDLTYRAAPTSKDELGELVMSLQRMSEQLHVIVANVRSGSDNIATASGEIASGNLDLSSRTEEQAGALEETAASIEQLTSSVRQNADNSNQAHQLVTTAAQVVNEGGDVMSQLTQTMSTINESSRKIVDIISVIDGIAFQTNILALNAAVEAARAGEQGRGFAVVASEVRGLAQRSATAAKEIKVLINESVDKVDSGSKLVELAGATMAKVVDSVQSANSLVSEINSASQEQAEGIKQVNQAITQMDGVTQQNAALVEQAAAAAHSLEDQAKNLKQLVSVFKLA
ncbi:methyl-accepting chemotaxis protein [Herbaspirillum lusitanum]|jgi:methyl-accepting chemotaxis protein|uniref:Methyl-accepting chemotaxis protein n=1 Tax=Herbaspirillum lusitanum TaxID=213312 RepID=A0ABW9ACP4_9BURK